MHQLSNKAMKAMNSLKKVIINSNLKCSDSLKLYDTMIKPISIYGSDIWGAFINNANKLFDCNKNFVSLDRLPFEKTNLSFCKFILRTHKRSSNSAVRGELGRFPILNQIVKNTLSNYFRIMNIEHNTLLRDCYECNIELLKNDKKCWLKGVKELCEAI